jgi:cytochrome c-type biogenesis protein CcmH/NrfG
MIVAYPSIKRQRRKMTMKNRCQTNRLAIVGFVLAIVFWSAALVSAKDCQELSDLDGEQLMEKISEMQKVLDQNPSDFETLKCIGIAYHRMARKDAKTYAPKAVEILTKAFEANRKDYESMCYLGSATTMMAKRTWNPMKKMTYVNKGAALMDKAIRKDPDNISVRMTRAYNSKSLPSFLNRGHLAVEDFEYLADLIEKNPKAYASIKKDVYTNLCELYRKAGDQAKADTFKNLVENL